MLISGRADGVPSSHSPVAVCARTSEIVLYVANNLACGTRYRSPILSTGREELFVRSSQLSSRAFTLLWETNSALRSFMERAEMPPCLCRTTYRDMRSPNIGPDGSTPVLRRGFSLEHGERQNLSGTINTSELVPLLLRHASYGWMRAISCLIMRVSRLAVDRTKPSVEELTK